MAITGEIGRKFGTYTRSTIIRFSSFYLLVLAFFIVLVSIYYSEKNQIQGGDGQLEFHVCVCPPAAHRNNNLHLPGSRNNGADEIQDQINRLFAAALGVEQVQIVTPGRAMRSAMDADVAHFVLGGVLRQIDNKIGINGYSEGAKSSESVYKPDWELSLAHAGADANALMRAGYGDRIATFGLGNAHASRLRELSVSQRDLLSRRIVIVAVGGQS